MTATRTIDEAAARFIVDLSYSDMPEPAIEGVRRLLTDQTALQVGCASLPWNQAILQLTSRTGAPGRSRVAVSGDSFAVADAAFVNATYGHSFEYDDAHAPSLSHPGSAVVSAALAVGEDIRATLRQVIEGIVAGYETYTRIGTLAAPHLLRRGFHPHAVLAPFGAAAVVAKMRGFDVETTRNALAIAFSHCSGTTEYTSSGGSIKRVHSGIATRNGVHAAEMAEVGITGPKDYLSGAKGFFQTFVKKDLTPADTEWFEAGRPFEVAGPLIKPYCCCAFNHAFIDGAKQFAGKASQIERIDLGIRASGDVVVGTSNAHAYAPEHIEHLQYSLPFQFALSLLGYGNGFATHRAYLNGELDLGPASDCAEIARRVKIDARPELDATYPAKMVADINVTFAGGKSEHVFVEDSVGSAPNPMNQDDLEAKFRDLTASTLGDARSADLLRTITDPNIDRPVTELVDLLVAERIGFDGGSDDNI